MVPPLNTYHFRTLGNSSSQLIDRINWSGNHFCHKWCGHLEMFPNYNLCSQTSYMIINKLEFQNMISYHFPSSGVSFYIGSTTTANFDFHDRLGLSFQIKCTTAAKLNFYAQNKHNCSLTTKFLKSGLCNRMCSSTNTTSLKLMQSSAGYMQECGCFSNEDDVCY